MKRLATALLVLVVTASIAPSVVAGSIAPSTTSPASATAGQASGQAYAGTHVSFDASERAVTDYAVHGETMLDSVKVQSESEVENGGLVGVGASLSGVTRIEGAGLGVGATTNTEARVDADSGATITAHDNGHGVLVVASGDQSEYVVANLSAGANASAESDAQVEVTTENGTEGTFVVVGEGNVTVNDEGDVTAQLGDDGRLAFRSYPEGKDDGDEKQEDLIASGESKAEAYVMVEDGETVVDTVSYDGNTTVEAAQTAEGGVSFTVNRTTHEGTVFVTSVSEKALNATEDLEVAVDGEAAVEARTYTQLKSAVGSEQSRYLVESAASGSADARTDVLVAVNHFSERTVSMQSESASDETSSETTDSQQTTDDGETTDDGQTTDESDGETNATSTGDDDTGNGGSVPGFTPVTAVVAVVAATLLARLR
ncbi:PGF-CTERM sorting domain-containing protein [Halorussus salinisoli]|uniref:PGF-CTERM sorting domain-containing protein n=1 Tax=Halorussus salinisoli TaxID=2558242 RepID=UPI0010C1EEEF|nr:PGF-CTERM sorting domain-containing protein [Halorussus salinisoli]